MNNDAKKEPQEITKPSGNNDNPFKDLKPAEIPTAIHKFSYEGDKETREKKNK